MPADSGQGASGDVANPLLASRQSTHYSCLRRPGPARSLIIAFSSSRLARRNSWVGFSSESGTDQGHPLVFRLHALAERGPRRSSTGRSRACGGTACRVCSRPRVVTTAGVGLSCRASARERGEGHRQPARMAPTGGGASARLRSRPRARWPPTACLTATRNGGVPSLHRQHQSRRIHLRVRRSDTLGTSVHTLRRRIVAC